MEKKNYITTAETKAITGLDDSGIRKVRKIYQNHGRLGRRELFTKEQVDELCRIVEYQRHKPHLSYAVAYENVAMQNKIDTLFSEFCDDAAMMASLAWGEKNTETFFLLFNNLTDFIKPFDQDSFQLLVSVQSLILSKIGMTQMKKKEA